MCERNWRQNLEPKWYICTNISLNRNVFQFLFLFICVLELSLIRFLNVLSNQYLQLKIKDGYFGLRVNISILQKETEREVTMTCSVNSLLCTTVENSVWWKHFCTECFSTVNACFAILLHTASQKTQPNSDA